MDDFTKNRTSGSLIGIGLDQLHRESKEWINSVEFWKDELHFLDSILRKKINDNRDQMFMDLLVNMGKVHDHLFTYLIKDIYDHEKLLSRLIKGEKGQADVDYRNGHKELKGKIDLFAKDFKEFKKMVFGYAKKF